MTVIGRINSDTLTAEQNRRGVNMLAHRSGWAASRCKELMEKLRDEKNYEISDQLREVVAELDTALGFLGIQYTEK